MSAPWKQMSCLSRSLYPQQTAQCLLCTGCSINDWIILWLPASKMDPNDCHPLVSVPWVLSSHTASGLSVVWLLNLSHKRHCSSQLYLRLLILGEANCHAIRMLSLERPTWKGIEVSVPNQHVTALWVVIPDNYVSEPPWGWVLRPQLSLQRMKHSLTLNVTLRKTLSQNCPPEQFSSPNPPKPWEIKSIIIDVLSH